LTAFTETYGASLHLERCLLGGNLNLAVVRGFARLDVLADISAADVYDQATNPFGTQRDLLNKHAREATDYALEAITKDAASSPRAFPEIILNARDRNVLSVFAEDGAELNLDSTEGVPAEPVYVRVTVNSRSLDWPKGDRAPQISRLDGNHRLSQIPELEDRDPDLEFPLVPFALFVGLTADQERALFRDINANQRRMETAHLDTILYRLSRENLLLTASGRALWIAEELVKPGEVFAEKVFHGGAKTGTKKAQGYIPPIKISTLKAAIQTTLREASKLEANSFPTHLVAAALVADDSNSPSYKDLERNAYLVKELLSRYWTAVRDAFPDAWQDRTNYILLQSIGLTAFSQLAAEVVQELVDEKAYDPDDFALALKQIAGKVSLEKTQYAGLAGLSGAKQVFLRLVEAKDTDEAAYQEMLRNLNLDSEQSLIDEPEGA
jgi:DGQHR domain-containing protein